MIIAACGKLMRRLATLHTRLLRASYGSSGLIGRAAILSLCFPVFWAHSFLFEIASALQARNIRHATRRIDALRLRQGLSA